MAGFTLSSRETSGLRTVIDASRSTSDMPLPWPVLEELRELLRASSVGFTCLDSAAQRVVFQQFIEPWDEHGCESETPEEARQNPFWLQYWGPTGCNYPDRSGNYRFTRRASDHSTLAERRDVSARNEDDGSYGLRFLETVMPGRSPGRYFRIGAYRSGRDFTDRDLFQLELLQPHLERAFWAGTADRVDSALTPRQRHLLTLAREGLSNRQIARRAGVSEGTVRVHMTNIFERLGVQSRGAAVHQVFDRAEDLWIGSGTRSPA